MKIEARSVSLGEESQRSLAPILSFPSSRTATCAKIGEQVLLTDSSKALQEGLNPDDDDSWLCSFQISEHGHNCQG